MRPLAERRLGGSAATVREGYGGKQPGGDPAHRFERGEGGQQRCHLGHAGGRRYLTGQPEEKAQHGDKRRPLAEETSGGFPVALRFLPRQRRRQCHADALAGSPEQAGEHAEPEGDFDQIGPEVPREFAAGIFAALGQNGDNEARGDGEGSTESERSS